MQLVGFLAEQCLCDYNAAICPCIPLRESGLLALESASVTRPICVSAHLGRLSDHSMSVGRTTRSPCPIATANAFLCALQLQHRARGSSNAYQARLARRSQSVRAGMRHERGPAGWNVLSMHCYHSSHTRFIRRRTDLRLLSEWKRGNRHDCSKTVRAAMKVALTPADLAPLLPTATTSPLHIRASIYRGPLFASKWLPLTTVNQLVQQYGRRVRPVTRAALNICTDHSTSEVSTSMARGITCDAEEPAEWAHSWALVWV